MFILSNALAFATLATSAPVPKPKPSDYYFPTVAGTTWETDRNGLKHYYIVYKVEWKDGTATVSVGPNPKPPRAVITSGVTPSYTMSVSKEGVYCLVNNLFVCNPPECWLKFPINDEEWTTGESQKRRIGKPETITVKAGKFEAIPVCDKIKGDDSSPKSITRWYAPGMGIVREDRQYVDGVSFTEMTSFVLGDGVEVVNRFDFPRRAPK